MTNAWITWAYQQKGLSVSEKFVLVVLADHADETGYCYPSQKRMADYTGLTVRSIRRACEGLAEKGFIKKRLDLDPRKKSDSDQKKYQHYCYDLQEYQEVKPEDRVSGGQSVRGTECHEPEDMVSQTGGHSVPLTPIDPSIEPSTMSADPPTPRFEEFWIEWKKSGLANSNESKKQAQTKFTALKPPDRRRATELCGRFQRLFREENNADTTMLHAQRYLSQRRWEGFDEPEDDPAADVPSTEPPVHYVHRRIFDNLGEKIWLAWFNDCDVGDYGANGKVLTFPTKFKADYVNKTYGDRICQILPGRIEFVSRA